MLDTNVLLRLVLADVPAQHRAAVALVNGGGSFAVPDVAIVEMVFALESAYALPRSAIAETLHVILGHPSFECSTNALVPAIELYLDHPKLSFVDCYLAQLAAVGPAAPLWTFDRTLANQTGAELVPPIDS